MIERFHPSIIHSVSFASYEDGFLILDKINRNPFLSPRTAGEIDSDIGERNILVIKSQQEVIAFLRKKRLTEEWIEIGSLYVEPEFRGWGLAQRLVSEAAKIPKENFLAIVSNETAEKVFENAGFVKTHRKEIPLAIFKELIKDRSGSIARVRRSLTNSIRGTSFWVWKS